MPKFKPEKIAVLCLVNGDTQRAQALANSLELPLLFEEVAEVAHYVVVSNSYVGLRTSNVASTDLVAEFVSGKTGYRFRKGEGKNQPLAKAVGIKGEFCPNVLDLTAGLARDAFVLASLGCELTLVERSPFLFTILDDGLQRAKTDEEVSEVVGRMHWMQGQAIDYLNQLNSNFPDVIYLDPMYPHKQKSALVKKEMRIIREFVGDDNDTLEVLLLSQQKAKKRVVVKRPKTAPPIVEAGVNFTVESKNTRYDIYLPISYES